jgi:hypothetical protein
MAMKPKNSGSLTRTQTASWQYDSADYAAGMDNKDHPSYKALSKYSGNQHGGAAEGNFGRGPTVGNRGCGIEGPATPPTTKTLPNTKSACDKAYAGTFNAGAQVRTPGGTRPFMPSATENYNGNYNKINFGRGPTKGNSQ